jgi:tetratricopeptide (TPR) repeat protein
LAMRQRLYQEDHADIAASLTRLGSDLHRLGELEPARELFEQALAMRQRLYQGDHPDVASGLSNLGSTLRELGDLERARELHEQALGHCCICRG